MWHWTWGSECSAQPPTSCSDGGCSPGHPGEPESVKKQQCSLIVMVDYFRTLWVRNYTSICDSIPGLPGRDVAQTSENGKNSRIPSSPPRSEQNSCWLQVLSPAFRTDLRCSRLGSAVSSVKKHKLETETRTKEERLPGVWDGPLCALPRATWKIAKWEGHPWGLCSAPYRSLLFT